MRGVLKVDTQPCEPLILKLKIVRSHPGGEPLECRRGPGIKLERGI